MINILINMIVTKGEAVVIIVEMVDEKYNEKHGSSNNNIILKLINKENE